MKRTYRYIAIVVTLMMVLTMSMAGVVFAKGGSAAGPGGPGANSSSGGSGASGAGAAGGDGGPGGGGGDGAGVGNGLGAVGGMGGGGTKPSKFLTPDQEYTLDTFNSCAVSYAGALIDGLSPDGAFSFSTRYRSDANGIKDCMAKKGFKFSR